MARPEDAVYFRRAWGKLLQDPYYGGQQAYFVAPFRVDMTDEQKQQMLRWAYIDLMRAFEFGTTFYILDEIGAVLERVMERVEHKRVYHFEEQDFQGTDGFLYLDWPFLIPNSQSKTGYQRVIAIGWSRLDGTTEEDEEVRELGKTIYTVCENVLGNDGYIGHQPYVTRHRIPVMYGVRLAAGMGRVDTYASDVGLLPRETKWERELRKREEDESADRILRLFYAWAMFAQTEITASNPHYLSRAQQKGFSRDGRPLPEIRVITLRRYADDPQREPGETLVEWSHRWEVRGHMRQIKVHRDSTETRWVYVRKHVKGPANKPLLLRETVEAYKR
jgi:hypothetical protein